MSGYFSDAMHFVYEARTAVWPVREFPDKTSKRLRSAGNPLAAALQEL
jgi:hypothetical protein